MGWRSILRAALERFPVAAASYREIREMVRLYHARAKETPHGFLFCGDRRMETGTYEPFETKVVETLLPHVEVVVNVGANVGYYACLARFCERRVVAFEPIAANVRFLLRNLKANGWSDVEVLPVALSDRVGVAEIYGGGTGASLLRGWAGISERFCRLVPTNTLDNLLGGRFDGQQILFIVDVEGTELAVLNGARHYLSMVPKPIWLVEVAVTEHLPAGLGVNPNLLATFEVFWREGYAALRLAPGLEQVSQAEVSAIQRSGRNMLDVHNFLFVDVGECQRLKEICLQARRS